MDELGARPASNVGVEIILDEGDLRHVGKPLVGDFLEQVCVIHGGVAIGHLDVLDVYHRPRDPECPVVCLDETSKQLGGIAADGIDQLRAIADQPVTYIPIRLIWSTDGLPCLRSFWHVDAVGGRPHEQQPCHQSPN